MLPWPLAVGLGRSLFPALFYNNTLAAAQAPPHSLEWWLRSLDYLALTTLGACHRAGSAPPLATVALMLLSTGDLKLFQEAHSFPWTRPGWESQVFSALGPPHLSKATVLHPESQHSDGSGSWDLKPAPMFSSCFGAALTLANGPK